MNRLVIFVSCTVSLGLGALQHPAAGPTLRSSTIPSFNPTSLTRGWLDTTSLGSPATGTPLAPRFAPATGGDEGTLAERDLFDWVGTYDIVGTNFPEGERHAVITISPRDTAYHLAVSGPPGTLVSLQIAGDSAHFVWDFQQGGPVMHADLRGMADSLDGTWTIGERVGLIYGTRRR